MDNIIIFYFSDLQYLLLAVHTMQYKELLYTYNLILGLYTFPKIFR
jgi:hypothetical protein